MNPSLKALYENGWHTGLVKYYNSKLGELKIDFTDGSSDYVAPADIDGEEIFLE